MKYTLALTVALTATWLLLSGYYDKPLLLGLGAFSVLVSVFFAIRLGVADQDGAPIDLFPGVLAYWFWLLVEIGKANIVVARAALAPELKLSPKLFWVDAEPKSDIGVVTLANSITLTPGTVSVDVDRGRIYVHALSESLADPAGIKEMGARIAKIEPKPRGGAR